jgi:phospholipase/lecithinase/hemolysin
MNTLKRMMVAVLALLPLATGMAFADTEHSYSRIFIFGASFMDSGNHFAVTGETAHPPFEYISFASYGVGGHRPTNGRTWVEVLAQEMELTEWAKPAYRDPAFGNYAFSYGRAREVDPDAFEASLYDQVQAWRDNGYCTLTEMNDTLFIVDSGYRDLLDIAFGAPAEEVIPLVMTSIAENIGILHMCGARNLLISNLPDMGTAPITPDGGEAGARYLSETYNAALQGVIDFYSNPVLGMNISVANFFGFVDVVMAMPGEFGLTNVDDACVTPYVLKDAFCKDRDEYFWWDRLHPSRKAHALLAEFALTQLPVPD